MPCHGSIPPSNDQVNVNSGNNRLVLVANDHSLTELLKGYEKILGQSVDTAARVFREDGSEGIVDLALGRRVKNADPAKWEFLVIELKRPAQKIDHKAVQQLKSYARAVSSDDRFHQTGASWEFWAVSNSLSKDVEGESQQPNRPRGMILEERKPRITVWVKTWGELINDRLAHLDFFQTQLNHHADGPSGLEHLKSSYRQYLPTTAFDHEDDSS